MSNKHSEFYEKDLKDFILTKERMFGDLGKSAIVFEKSLSSSRTQGVKQTIADCLIFTEQKGVIGVEIKTAKDSTTRLNRQLQGYSLTCDFVYVMCHDNHVEKVEKILDRYRHHHVGIIAYADFKGNIVAGIYRQALKSPRKSSYYALNMLWKTEIVRIMGTFRHPASRLQEEGYTYLKFKDRSNGMGGSYSATSFGPKLTKHALLVNLVNILGEEEATKVLCDIMINNRNAPEKSIKLRHFKNPEPIREENKDEL